MFLHPPVFSDWPKVAGLYWEFENKRVLGYFGAGTRRIIWRWKNLDAGALSLPRTQHAEAAETVCAPSLHRSSDDRLVDLVRDVVPLGSIECLTGLYVDDNFLSKCEHNSTGRACERKIELIRITGAVR